MNRGLLIVVCTALVFAAGFASRALVDRSEVPPAPVIPAAVVPKESGPVARGRGPTRAEMLANIQTWSAQIDVFRKRVAELDAEFDTAFVALLNPKQHEAWNEMQRRFRGGGGPGRGGENPAISEPRPPMSDAELEARRRQPLNTLARMLAVKERVEQLARNYSLTPEQQEKTHGLLVARRDKFIALTEELSVMSIQYSALATEVNRLAVPAAEPAPKNEAGAPAAPVK